MNIYSYTKQCWKYLTFSILSSNFLGQRFFPNFQFVAVNAKYSLVSHIFELGILYNADKRHQKMSKFFSFGSHRVPAQAEHFPFSEYN